MSGVSFSLDAESKVLLEPYYALEMVHASGLAFL